MFKPSLSLTVLFVETKQSKMKLFIYTCSIFLLVACGNSDKGKSTEKKTSIEQKKSVQTEKESAPQETIEINLSAIGESMAEIAFEPKSISIPANSKVNLTFENKSSAEGMLHNFVLVELGSGQEISSAGIKAGKANNFVPKDKRVIVYTKVCEMGEKVSISFNAPPKGSYHYICTYPGHTNMIGRLNVE